MENTPTLRLIITDPAGLELARLDVPAPMRPVCPDMTPGVFDPTAFRRMMAHALEAFEEAYLHDYETRQPATQ